MVLSQDQVQVITRTFEPSLWNSTSEIVGKDIHVSTLVSLELDDGVDPDIPMKADGIILKMYTFPSSKEMVPCRLLRTTVNAAKIAPMR
jgi:hypothetical protein